MAHAPHRRTSRVALLAAVVSMATVVGAAGPASATPAPAPRAVRPTATPSTDLLTILSNILAQVLPALPPLGSGTPAVGATTIPSTVRVDGAACGFHLAGSGFSPAPDVVVTNAHVVAGETVTSVLRPDGRTLPATVQAFDPKRDLAVLVVPGLGEPSLPLAPAVTGEADAIFAHPLGRAGITMVPARITRRVTADLGDIYDQSGAPRQILVMNAVLQPGDSGAPVVNAAGQVVGVAFGGSTLSRSTSFAVAEEELAPVLALPRTGPVSTGPCLPD